MKMSKLFTLIAIVLIATGITSCHTSKKRRHMSYMDMCYKELRMGLQDAQVIRSKDSVKVIYPELAMFDFNKDNIKTSALPSLQKFAGILKKYDHVYFYINGYTDNVGTDDVNISLSQRRADNTKILFRANSIADSRITTQGMGSSNPVMSNATADGRQANRRVEFVLYEKK